MQNLLQSKFLDLYWHYFVAGLTVYIGARLIYHWLNSKKQPYCWRKSPDQTIEENEEEDEDENFDQLSPALPEDLEHVPLVHERLSVQETIERADEFYKFMNNRRTVRHFSNESVPIEVIYNIIKTAGTAPSGAHTEPWTYVVVESPDIKAQIREIVEAEEEVNYKKRMGKVWTTDLRPLRTTWVKDYLTEAPYLVVVFKQMYSLKKDGKKKVHYYKEQSVSLAAGMLLTAIHYAGLVSLTSTPLNCGSAIRLLLGRPINEKLALLVPVGYPAKDCLIPDLQRKPLDEILVKF